MGKEGEHTCTSSLYTRVTTGTACERIKSMDNCKEAATQLGLDPDRWSGLGKTSSHKPPYCYLYNYMGTVLLNFNHDVNSAAQCNSDSSICICHIWDRVTKGSTCERITSKAECKLAGEQLGLANSVKEETTSDWPPYCYFYKGPLWDTLYFNNAGNSEVQCNSDDKVCICKTT